MRFQVVGMSAAILQGCPATTLDTDLGIDLPPRAYLDVMRFGSSGWAPEWLGTRVAGLPLSRILRSKMWVGRPKNRAHLPLLEQTIKLRKRRAARV